VPLDSYRHGWTLPMSAPRNSNSGFTLGAVLIYVNPQELHQMGEQSAGRLISRASAMARVCPAGGAADLAI